MRRVLVRPLLAAIVLSGGLVAAAPAWAAGPSREQMAACTDEETQDYRGRADACTALIEGGRLSSDQLITVLSHRASARSDLQDFKGAIADLDRAIGYSPEAVLYNNRAFAKSHAGDLQGALADYSEAIRLDPKMARSYANRGAVYYRLKEYKRALSDLDMAIMLDPTRPKAFNNRALAKVKLGDKEGALADYTKALELNPRDATALANRGQLYEEMSEPSLALADYNAALKIEPRSATILGFRGDLMRGLGQDDRAAADYDAGVRADPSDPEAHYARCFGLGMMKRDLMSARGSCDDAIRLDPDNAQYVEFRGVIGLLLGDNESALRDFDRALAMGGPDSGRNFGRGVALRRLGRTPEGDAELAYARRADSGIERAFARLGIKP